MSLKSTSLRCGIALLPVALFIQFTVAQPSALTDIKIAPYPANADKMVKTYINPVLGGDHPDPTLLKVGDDFYRCGSSFHFTPYLPILHSKDLLHWEVIARVIPADWANLKSGSPGAGIWQGAITYFYGAYHIYFSNGPGGGQYMSSASKPSGPWSIPEKVQTTAETGAIGYDNSIFVDDDGTPYMIIKAGQTANRIQQIGHSGNLTGRLINLDWINRDKKYSWAEGPVMCKRNGWYYYFMAGDVTGGQFVLRSKSLTSDSARWQNLGKIFAFSKDPDNRFRSANHMSSPFQLKDGTWWCIAQSYDAPKGDDWSGQGRQDLLLQVQWTADGRPFVPYPSDGPLTRPQLANNGLPWRLPRSDEFSNNKVSLYWHFLNKNAAGQYSLSDRPGWLRLSPVNGITHILQKEAGRSYALVTRVDINASNPGEQAGLYLTSGDESVNVRLFSGFYEGKKKICFAMGKNSFSMDNTAGDVVWLKLIRNNHDLKGFWSADGITWSQVGEVINAADMDKTQPKFNSWVGTSAGLFANAKPADFDFYLYKDGFTKLPLSGANNYFGLVLNQDGATLDGSGNGWAMLGGTDFGPVSKKAQSVSLSVSAIKRGMIELWIDDLMAGGTRIAEIPVKSTGGLNKPVSVSATIPAIVGQHDLYIKVSGANKGITVHSIQFK